jgi:hypothetical protein
MEVYHNKMKYYTHYTINQTNISTIKLDGYKTTRKLLRATTSLITFPDSPETRAAGLDPNMEYTVEELATKSISPSLFRRIEPNYINDILLYPKDKTRVLGCLDLAQGDGIAFADISAWNTITYQGTGEFIVLGNNIGCNVGGTLYDIKVYDVNGKMIHWYPCCEYFDNTVYDVITQMNGTVVNGAVWVTQDNFDYPSAYGGHEVTSVFLPAKYINKYNYSGEDVTGTPLVISTTTIDRNIKALAYTKDIYGL